MANFNVPMIAGYITLFVVVLLIVAVMIASLIDGMVQAWNKRHPHYDVETQSRKEDDALDPRHFQ